MNTKGIIYLYASRKWAYHLKIVLFSALLALLVASTRRNAVFSEIFLSTFFMLFVQIEIFLWLGKVFFSSNPGKTIREITKNTILKFLAFYISCLVVAAITFTLMMIGWYYFKNYNLSQLAGNLIHVESKGFLISTNFGLLLGTILFFYFQWQETLRREHKLIEEKLVFQYETLKNQVNPHFLFNSLNTLSSLVHSKEAKQADAFINKLSAIYRYVLEKKDMDLVDLETEIRFAEDYFYLHKIRDEEKISLEISIDSDKRFKVLPISLQILIENALKHNVATRTKPLHIKIYLEGDNLITVENNLQKKQNMDASSKIGLKNLGERIRLITDKEIVIEEDNPFFRVKLPLITG